MSVGIGLKRCCLECSRPRLELVEIKRGIFDRDVNVYCECSDICRAYAVDEGDVVSVQNCDRDALLALADEFEDTANELLELVGEAGDDIRPYISNSAEGTLSYARRIREACGEGER